MLREKFGCGIFHEDWVCSQCQEIYCEYCSAPFDQFSQIDYNFCLNCYDERQRERAEELSWGIGNEQVASTGGLTLECLQKAMKSLKDTAVPNTLMLSVEQYKNIKDTLEFVGSSDSTCATLFGLNVVVVPSARDFVIEPKVYGYRKMYENNWIGADFGYSGTR